MVFGGVGLAAGAGPAEAATPAGPGILAPGGVTPDTTGSVLLGRILASGFRAGEGLPGAVLELRQQGRLHTVTTSASGDYRVEGLAPGPASIRVFHIAARPSNLEVTLPPHGVFELDVEMERRILALAPLTVEISGLPILGPRTRAPLASGSAGSVRLTQAAMRSTTGMVESGLVQGPGPDPRDPGDAGSVLYMRGATSDSRQVLLDGAPILTPFHLAGVLPSFDLGVLRDAHFHSGGASPRHDGGLSYILELTTRDPVARHAPMDSTQVEVVLDPFSGRLGVDLPLHPGVGLVGVIRGLHGLGGNGMGEDATLPYLYRDATLRLGVRPWESFSLHLTAFRNREGVWLGELARPPVGSPEQTPATSGTPSRGLGPRDGWFHDRAAWGNEALSARWRWDGARALNSVAVEGGVAVSRYEAALPVPWIDPMQARTEAQVLRGDVVVTHRVQGRPVLQWGGSVERRTFDWELLALTPSSTQAFEARQARAGSTRAGVFGEFNRDLTPELRLDAGMRLEAFGADESLRLAPRVALRQALGDAAHLTFSVGRFHEVLPVSALRSEGTTPENASVFWSPGLGVASATHGVLTLDQVLSDELRVEVSGFVKQFAGAAPSASSEARSRAHASGTELRVTRDGDRFQGWIGYALTWVWSAGFSDFAGRHLLSTGGSVQLPGRTEMGVVVGYGAGLPLTGVGLAMTEASRELDAPGAPAVPTFQSASTVARLASMSSSNPLEVAREDAFFRVDLDLSWELTPTVGGRVTSLRPYLRVLNALDRRDAHFHYFDRWRGEELRPLATRPFLPIVGVAWRF